MDLTNLELESIYEVLYDEYFYGRELIYQDSADADAVGTGLTKFEAEIKKRGL